jgi:endonuclease/exonuclease/phosphatase family metal-dependent hydrolase
MSCSPLIRASALALLLALTPARAADEASSGGPQVTSADVAVMSFNIRYGTADDGPNRWARRKRMVYALLRRQGADVIALQEALRPQLDELHAALPAYGELGRGRDDGATKGEYAAILYRRERFDVDESGTFWLSDTPEVPGSITWGNACTRICTWGRFVPRSSGRAFYVFNVHLDHISQPSREKGVALVLSRVRDRRQPDPIVLTGDFNVDESNPIVRYLEGGLQLQDVTNGLAAKPLPLVDTFRLLHKDATRDGTFHEFKGYQTGNRIDYIFTQPDVAVLRAEILRDSTRVRYPSDHFPITAVLRFAPSTSNGN